MTITAAAEMRMRLFQGAEENKVQRKSSTGKIIGSSRTNGTLTRHWASLTVLLPPSSMNQDAP